MALVPGPTGKGEVSAEEQFLAPAPGVSRGMTTVRVIVESTSAAPAGIRIQSLHGETHVAEMLAGETDVFRVGDGGLSGGYARGIGGTASIRWYANAVT